jgi:hypothetical protein
MDTSTGIGMLLHVWVVVLKTTRALTYADRIHLMNKNHQCEFLFLDPNEDACGDHVLVYHFFAEEQLRLVGSIAGHQQIYGTCTDLYDDIIPLRHALCAGVPDGARARSEWTFGKAEIPRRGIG